MIRFLLEWLPVWGLALAVVLSLCVTLWAFNPEPTP